MNFKDTKNAIMLTMAAGKTPIIVGDRGIGKTQMMKDIAKRLNMRLINIDCNLLKEGEIGGMPIPDKNDKGIMVTEYAIHTKLKIIEDYLEENKDSKVLLFFDELNRSTREVMSELMNLILNREINGHIVPNSVQMVAAMNPTSTTEGFEGDTSYGVTEMDAASKNRLVWLYLEQESRSWLSWATRKPKVEQEDMEEIKISHFDINEYETIIDNRIVEFIANFPKLLNMPREDRDVSPSGRTWQFASDILRTYDANKKSKIFTEVQLDACIKGCIGDEAYIQFMAFLQDNCNPIPKPEQFWEGKKINQDLLKAFKDDTIPRKMIIANSIARYLAEKSKLTKDDAARLCEIYDLLPIDLLISVLRDIKSEHLQFYKKAIKNDSINTLFYKANTAARM